MEGDVVGRMGTGVDGENREQLAHVPELHHARRVTGSNGVPLPEMGTKQGFASVPVPTSKPLGSQALQLCLNK